MAGDVEIGRVGAGDLQEDTRIRSPLVRLSGRVLETRPEAETGRRAGRIAKARTHGGQCLRVRRIALDIGEQRHIVAAPCAGMHTAEMALEIARQRVVPPKLVGIARISIESETLLAEQRLLRGQTARLLIRVGQRARLLLAGLYIRLIEWVDQSPLQVIQPDRLAAFRELLE